MREKDKKDRSGREIERERERERERIQCILVVVPAQFDLEKVSAQSNFVWPNQRALLST